MQSKRYVTNAAAKDIVEAVRRYRECDTRAPLTLPPFDANAATGDGGTGGGYDWFQACAAVISDACDQQRCRPLVVGVFQNEDPEVIRATVEEVGLDMVQLHGDEGFEAADQSVCGVPAFRVVHIPAGGDGGDSATPQSVRDSITSGHAAGVLLDTSVKGVQGGTGTSFDWNLAAEVADIDVSEGGRGRLPLIVAGGLRPDNVAEAVVACRPWAVDVAGGVETEDGATKDVEKVKAFVHNAKRAGQ